MMPAHRQDFPRACVLATGLALCVCLPLAAEERPPQPGHLLSEGQVKVQHRDFAGAVDSLTAWLKVYPDDSLALFYRAHARTELGDQHGAAEDIQRITQRNLDLASKAARESPGDKAALAAFAFARLEAGDVHGAIESYGKVLSIDPNDGQALFDRANARHRSGDREGALKDYAAALERDQHRPEIYVARAHTRLALGNIAGADTDLQRALELGSHRQ